MGRIRGKILSFTIALVTLVGGVYADSAEIDKQRQLIASLEKQVAAGEREVESLRKSKAANEVKVRTLAQQVETRNRLLTAQRSEEVRLRGEMATADLTSALLLKEIEKEREQYAKMVRGAYRSYSNNSVLMYLFASESFQDVARRIANLRAVALLRAERIERIDSLSTRLNMERAVLSDKSDKLKIVVRDLTTQRANLQRDVNSARASITAMSAKERKVLQERELQQRKLDSAVKELQKLIKGNQAGASFSAKSHGLRLPVQGGRVKQYKDNMAEVVGAKEAKVCSIYEGKVVDVRMNRITGKYDIYIAHGEYITSYAGLSQVSVAKDDIVLRDGVIGVIGQAVDIISMVSEYKIVFGIYPPNASEKVSAMSCFKK